MYNETLQWFLLNANKCKEERELSRAFLLLSNSIVVEVVDVYHIISIHIIIMDIGVSLWDDAPYNINVNPDVQHAPKGESLSRALTIRG